MQDPISELVRRGRELAPADRGRPLDQRLESLNEPAVAELDAAWEGEIERRLADYRAGLVRAIDGDDVFAKARRLAK